MNKNFIKAFDKVTLDIFMSGMQKNMDKMRMKLQNNGHLWGELESHWTREGGFNVLLLKKKSQAI